MVPDKVAAVLRDYRSGKAKSATELAKLHGVSRSAVYRLLSKETSQEKTEAQRPERQEQVKEDSPQGNFMDSLMDKAEQFANTLGLPDDAGKISHVEPEDEKEKEEKERQLEMVMDAMLGNNSGLAGLELKLPKGMEEALGGPLPKMEQRLQEHESPPESRYGLTEAKRAELTQKIVFNVQHFGPQLEIITGPNKAAFIQTLSSLSPAQLKDLLTTLERTRSVGNMAAGFKQVFYVASQGAEVATQLIGMRTQGFSQQLKQQDEEITMIMKELAIEQWERLKAMDSPQARLGLLFCATLVQTDTRNRLADHMRSQQAVPASVMAGAADL
jgi:hypothetical protein